jgi:uncharacterized protein (DUF169 family)
MSTASQLVDLLHLRIPPVAITFQDSAPTNIPRVTSPGPAGCSYWKRAAAGETFYTEASDHYNCPIGTHTHGVELPEAQANELKAVVGTMIQLGYLRPEEVARLPRRDRKFGVAVYAPLAATAAVPDVVLVRGNAKQMMLLAEAAQAAGVGSDSAIMGRPTCAAIPEALRTMRSVASLGCIGNRVYNDLGDDELYFALPGTGVGAVVEKLAIIINANRELESYHKARAS